MGHSGRKWDWEFNMCRRLRVARAAIIVLLSFAAVLGGVSVASADNSTCLACHSASVEFEVGPVDRDTACIACHNASMVGTHPYHQAGANCGAYCHPGWGQSLLAALPTYTDPVSGASFASPTSINTDPALLHIIHSSSRWIADIDTADSRCASCHAMASCDACHQSATSATHAAHSSSVQSPWSGRVAHGVVDGDQTIYSATTETNYCATAGCHDLASTQDNGAVTRENFSHPASVEYGLPENVVALTPSASSWRMSYKPVYTLGRMSYSNVTNAGLSITFEGEKVVLVSDRDPYRGIAQVWIDGGLAATVDMYAPTTINQAVVFESGILAAGTHTIEVRATGSKNPSARYNYVTVDCFKTYSVLPDSIAPDCAESCHADKASDHGGSFDHEATRTAGLYPAGRFDCTDCHSLGMWTEHGRTSSKTEAAGCAACHTVYADYALDEFSNPASTGYGSCTWAGDGSVTGCHQLANSEQPHNFIDSDHDGGGVAATADCRACHGNDLSIIHDDTNAARSQHASLVSNSWATDCLTCHGPDVFPSTKDCTDSGCHTGSGVVDMVSHPAPPHNGSNANVSVPRTGGELCSTCHILELTSEHGKSSSLTDPGAAAIGCADCHAAGYFPAGWLTVPNNTCQACHVVDSGDPGAATAGEPHESAEYASKHDWSATMGGSCGSCHDTDMIDFIHTDPLNATVTGPRGSSCQSCHTTPNAVPTVNSCYDCHTDHAMLHDTQETPTLTTDNADCLTCHSTFTSLVQHVTRGMVGGCDGCHDRSDAALDDYLQDNYEARCTDCHNSTVLGTYDYQPYDPNHYDPYLADHTATGMGTAIANKTCSSCHATSLKAEHTFTLSAGAVECFDCHTMNAPINARSVIAAGWTNDACADCHGSLHNSLGSAHDLANPGCEGGCHETSDVSVLHADAVYSLDSSITSCNVCHTNADTDLSAITGCVDCHTGMHDAAHSYDAASDYSDGAGEGVETGCSNSGAGCHGTDALRTDAATAYHPASGCVSGACHSSASFTGAFRTSGDDADCARCHDGSFTGAPDTIALGDETSAGHYDLDLHTATTGLGNVTAGGTASASCATCHELSLKDAHQGAGFSAATMGAKVTCGECHSSTSSEVKTDSWTNNDCAECHTINHTITAPVALATSTEGCGATGTNCHNTYDVHTLHKDAASCALSGCHQAATIDARPTAKSCGNTDACHDTYTQANHYNAGLHTSTTQGAAAYSLNGQSNTCSACHGMVLNAEHTKSTSAMSGSGSGCLKCHNNTGSTTAITGNWSTDLCNACHDGSGITAAHGNVSAHSATNTGCGSTGVGCHNTANLSRAGADKSVNIHNDCMTCHDPAGAASWSYGVSGNLAYAPSAKSCGQASGCHTSAYYSTATKVHSIGQGSEVNGDDSKHTASNMTSTLGAYSFENACDDCHTSTLLAAHATSSIGAVSCSSGGTGSLGCHNSTALPASPIQVKASWPTPVCADCHTASHTTYTTGTHTATLGTVGVAVSCANGGCHNTTDVRTIHDTAATGCANADCHALDKDMSSALMSCGSGSGGCHTDKTDSNHGPDHDYTIVSAYSDGSGEGIETGCAASGAGCHSSATSGDAVTTFHPAGAVSCLSSACHTSSTMNAAWKAGNNGAECAVCHSGAFSGAVDTKPLTDPTPGGHYSTALHTATAGLGTLSGGGSGSAACSVCHDLNLKDAHDATSGFSSKTRGAKVTCSECHSYNANVTTEVKTLSWQNSNCADCHNTTDMGANQAMHSATTAPVVTGSSTAGCGAVGNGCHNTYNLHTLHKDRSCTLSGCHDAKDKDMTSATKTCGQASGCHTSATFTSTNHNGLTGDDTTKHRAAGNAAASIGGYTQSTACVNCHTLTLKTAHTTRAGWTLPYCLNCHNSTSPNSVNIIKNTTWNNGTCEACHTTKHDKWPTASEHQATPGSGCTIGACHDNTTDVRAIHDKASAGCSASGSDTLGTNPACHQLDTEMAATTMGCGSGATGLACHTSHTHTNHGGSSGGQSCNNSGCHTASAYTDMVNATDSYHHVLDAADPWIAPGDGTYPTDTTSISCVTCHLDHSEYQALPGGSGKAFSLRNSATDANPTASDTDAPLCLSCHTSSLVRNQTGQKANVLYESEIWSLDADWFEASPHNYDAPGAFNDGSIFRANCAKCHGNLEGTLSSGKFSVHTSAEQRLINALGGPAPATLEINEEEMCFRCHSQWTDFVENGGTLLTGDSRSPDSVQTSGRWDWYGTQPMSVSNEVINSQMHASVYGHKPYLYTNKHRLSSGDESQAYLSNPANKHVECADCHNHHVVGDARHEFGSTNTVSEALRGVSGQAFNSAALATTNRPTDVQVNSRLSRKVYSDYEYEICFKCHTSANAGLAGWGGTITSLSNVGNAKPYGWSSYTGPSPAVTVNRWTNLAADFNVGNQSRHPVTAPNGAFADTTTYGTTNITPGQLAAGWSVGDTMYCSDCHGDPNAPSPWLLDVNGDVILDGNGDPTLDPDMENYAQGPHGSSVEYSLRGPRTDWPIATEGAGAGQLITMNMLLTDYDNLFCSNCHPGVRENKVHGGGQGAHGSAACVNCHISIPHGGGMSKLLGDGDGSMPARYAYNNDKRTMYISSFTKSADPSAYSKSNCQLTSYARTSTACKTNHSTGNSLTENW